MRLGQHKSLKAIATFMVFAIAQVYVQIGFAEPNSSNNAVPAPQQFLARLTTRGNVPITVNGNNATTGASIVTGAIIETGADQAATINIGEITLDIAPNTKLRLDYDENGRAKVFLIAGCAVVKARGTSEAEIETGDQVSRGKTEKSRGGVLDVCFIGGVASVNQGSASSAGAGAGPGTMAGGGGGGVSTGVVVAIVAVAGGAIAAAAALSSGDDEPIQTNPSPSSPQQ